MARKNAIAGVKNSGLGDAAAGRSVECVCVTLRRAARAFSAVYDAALAPSGIRITQFSLLRAIARLEPVSIGDLALAQVLDRTTLSRNLATLERRGYVQQAAAADRRISEIRVTTQGRAAIARALPLWRSTQRAVRRRFGPAALARLTALSASAEALAAALGTSEN